MSTFLQMAQALRQEAGISGTGPVTVTGQTGEMKRVCDWIARAWIDIQEEMTDWDWMRKTVTFNTIANQGSYAPSTDMALSDFGAWRKGSFRLYLTAAGVQNEFRLTQWDYNSFRDHYLLGARKAIYARPVNYAEAPDRSIVLGLAPDDVYTVTGEYYKTPVTLAADADTPDMPARFHNAIVYRALMAYGAYESAPEVYQYGEKEYRRLLNKLRMDQGPQIGLSGSMI